MKPKSRRHQQSAAKRIIKRMKNFRLLVVFLTLLVGIAEINTVQPSNAASIPKPDSAANNLSAIDTHSALHPELVLQTGHGHWVRALAYSPDGTLLATGGYDQTIKLWDTRTGELKRTISGQTYSVESLMFTPDGSSLISGGGSWPWESGGPSSGVESGEIKLWDVASGTEKQSISDLKRVIESVSLSKGGKKLASWDRQAVRLFDLQTNRLLWSSPIKDPGNLTVGRSRVIFLADDKTLAVCNGNGIELFNFETGQKEKNLYGSNDNVNEIVCSPDGRLLASAIGTWGSSWGAQGEIQIWDIETEKVKVTIKPPPGLVSGLAFSPDSKQIVSGHYHGEIDLWDATTGELEHEMKGHTAVMMAVAFSPDGKAIASGAIDNTTRVWDSVTGQQRGVLGVQKFNQDPVAFSPDSGVLAVGVGAGDVHIWDTRTGALLRTLHGTEGFIDAITFSPDGLLLAVGHDNGTVKLWSTANWQIARSFAAHESTVREITYSPSGKIIATCSGGDSGGSDTSIRLWDAQTGERLRTLTGHELWVFSIAFSPDGETLASAGGSPYDKEKKDLSEVKVWSVKSGELQRNLEGHKGSAFSVSFTPDGKTLLSTGFDRTIKLWNTETWQLRATLNSPAEQLSNSVLTRDGKTIVSGGVSQIQLWDIESGKVRQTLPKASDVLGSIALSPDGKTIAAGSYGQGVVHIWNIPLNKEVAWLVDLPSNASSLASESNTAGFPDSKAINLGDKAINIGDKPIEIGAKQSLPTTTDEYLVYTPEGYYYGSPAADRYARFRLGDTLYPAASFQTRYYRPELIKRALAGEPLPDVGTWKGAYPPRLIIDTPLQGTKVRANSIEVRFQTSDDSDVKSIVCFVNGTRIEAKGIEVGAKTLRTGNSGNILPSAHTGLRNFTIALPLPPSDKEIKLQALAIDDDGLQSAREEVLFSHDVASLPKTGSLLGLCIGVSRYNNPKLNLCYADRDATELAQALNKQRGIYHSAAVATLLNEKATRASIAAGLDSLIAQATKADTVMLLFSGHGWRSEERTFFFASADIDTRSSQSVAQTALPWAEVVSRLVRLSEKSRRVIVLLDACHSGSAVTNSELVRSVLSAESGVLVLASSKGEEISQERSDLEHGIFTKALLEAVNGQASAPGENSTTTLEFLAYVARRIKQLSEDTQHSYIPLLENFSTDDAIVAKS